MAGNPADELFRPPDLVGIGNPIVQSTIHEVAEAAASSSSQRREEAVHVATIEAEIDASRHNLETGHNLSDSNNRGHDGERQRIDLQMEVGKVESQVSGSQKSSHNQGQTEIHRQQSINVEVFPAIDSQNQQVGDEIGVSNIDSRREGELLESQQVPQEQEIHDNRQQGNSSIQIPNRNINLNEGQETHQYQQQSSTTNSRNSGSREAGNIT